MRYIPMMKGWGSIAVALLLALSACESTRDNRLSVADQVFGMADSHECRAVRAASLTRAAADIWPEQDWSAAEEAAQMMAEQADLKPDLFGVVADHFAYSFYTPLLERAAMAGISVAESATSPVSAARTILRVADLVQRLPQAAVIVGRVRADVTRCVATEIAGN